MENNTFLSCEQAWTRKEARGRCGAEARAASSDGVKAEQVASCACSPEDEELCARRSVIASRRKCGLGGNNKDELGALQ